jgi:hypothetical protein
MPVTDLPSFTISMSTLIVIELMEYFTIEEYRRWR